MRFRLISAEIVAAGALLVAVILVPPGELSKVYALILIVTSVLPGLMLTGDVKLLNVGISDGSSRLKFKVIASAAGNLLLGSAVLLLQQDREPLLLLVVFVMMGTFGATAQAFSSAWYYTQPDKMRTMWSKIASAAVKVGFAVAAIGLSEFTLALVGMTLGSMVEFALNFRTLPWHADAGPERRREIVSPLGAAYGASRMVSAIVRLGLEEPFGPLIASFLVIEQLVGGMNSMFEKYFVRSTRWRNGVRALKLAYLAAMIAALPFLGGTTPLPADRPALVWLLLLACAGLLPLAEMYVALQRRSQTFVAMGSSLVSLAIGAFLAIAWHQGAQRWAPLAAYILLPGMTFLFYWLSSIDAGHNAKR